MKERLLFMLFMGILFFLLYGSANQYAGLTAPHPSLFMEWEKEIPFVPSFIIPYMSSDLMFVIAFLLPYTRLELRVLAMRVLFIVFFSVLIFLLFPLSFSFEKPENDEFALLFGMLSADLPFNQLPSLHISFAVVLWASMRHQLQNVWLKYLVAWWFGLIGLSTLFVYQHHFVDLPTGVLMGLLALYVINQDSSIVQTFMTPRSLKMAFYYLLASILLMLLAFNYSWLFLYPFISLFTVSLLYAFGWNSILAMRSSFWRPFNYLLFAPYYLGNRLSWMYYKGNLPLMSHVNNSVYFGRLYTDDELKSITKKNVKHIISLASEHPNYDVNNSHHFYSLFFLDQTIPSPELLHEAVELIEKHKEEGVYVHCALGLSRSVLVISAWLLHNGTSRKEVETLMNTIRPSYVKSPYMGIALDIYEKHRRDLSL